MDETDLCLMFEQAWDTVDLPMNLTGPRSVLPPFTSGFSGGAVAVLRSSLTMTRCVVSDNAARHPVLAVSALLLCLCSLCLCPYTVT